MDDVKRLPPVRHAPARRLLSPVSGFLAEAGFTHSLTPARNCTFGCTYCYVPTMGVYGGLQPEDWQRWGQFTTVKENAAALLARELRPDQRIYCSPLVDPYQPVEAAELVMPPLIEVLLSRPPAVFVVQTRGPLVLRDVPLWQELARRTTVRISFSLTTDDDAVRRLYEPLCATVEERLDSLAALRAAGLEAYATLAPLLPCDPERLATLALEATGRDLIGDPLHVRAVKRHGATTRDAAWAVARRHGHEAWFEPAFQDDVVSRINVTATRHGHRFGIGPAAFHWLSRR